jgi:photolyase PhrII
MSVLPPHLAERTRRIGTRAENEVGRFVLYWMRTAVRGHENPALDVALSLANARRLPLLVYHAVSERYPYASDRHHTFILQGARDVARELAARGIPYALHVERPLHRGPHLRTLAAQALAVVTEDFPLDPLRGWTQALAEHALVAAVDTACVVPMKLVGRAYDRAFAFERATKALRAGRLDAPWVDVEPAFAMRFPELPFASVDPETMDVPELVAIAAIDHSVGPVAHTRGGSVAGYSRFDAFVAGALGDYHRTRNDPLAREGHGVSRMSAYLHYGHVSPMRIARTAAKFGGRGAEKYLDELLTWRELAYAFAAFSPAVDTLDALPDWARATLSSHAKDPRAMTPSWEALARGRTGDAFWDAAQASLRIHGELHNNARMTWGKALLKWTRDPQAALAMLIDLNHRYALDGRDPASYGGILWCLGQFDRPFSPERPILGTVRPRETSVHESRLDVVAYRARCMAPACGRPIRVVVVGAGLSGLACARTLADHGLTVTVVDKGMRPGGRATSRHDGADVFDHGAQFFTARSEWLRRHVTSWEADGIVARWTPRLVQTGGARPRKTAPWWVATPSMGALAAHLSGGLDIKQGTKVTSLSRDSGGTWSILATGPDGNAVPPLLADALVVTLPAAQSALLLGAVDSEWSRVAASAKQTPCWAVMLTTRGVGDLGGDVFEDAQGPIAWTCREASKPGRAGAVQDGESGVGEERWLLHASAAWSEAHLDAAPELVAQALSEAFLLQHGALVRALVLRVRAHLWRYAQGQLPEARGALFDASTLLAVCGDWVNGSRVEGALTSGVAAAGRLLGVVKEHEGPSEPNDAVVGSDSVVSDG